MKKTYTYENCTVNVHVPEDTEFQERLRKASEIFMQKVINGGNKNVHSSTSKNLRKE